jgi:anaerobic ribonucleoside-triphosphate reductase activating protein
MRLSAVVFPVRNLGPGNRLGVWFQGCGIKCPGCMSMDTWNHSSGITATTQSVLDSIKPEEGLSLDGLTVSGGEPFEQVAALLELIVGFRDRFPVGDVLVYSGLDASTLRTQYSMLLSQTDAVVAGPFVEAEHGTDHWRGSGNQELLVMSERAETAIVPWVKAQSQSSLSLSVHGEAVQLIGIPRVGELARIRTSLEAQGIRLGAQWPR